MNIDIFNIPLPDFSVVPQLDLATGFRNVRDQLLKDHVDTMNPIRYAALTDEQKAEIATYRTALLAVPQQAGWPTDIEWPTKPSWL